jgi:aspartate kinase
MEVYKFGGASVKDAESVKNVIKILKSAPKTLVVVISAMGKSTNLLEKILSDYYKHDTNSAHEGFEQFKAYHIDIIKGLFNPIPEALLSQLNNFLVEMEWILEEEPHENYNFQYDQWIGFGELLSTSIVAHYAQQEGLNIEWMDARGLIITDNVYRDANVDLELSQQAVKSQVTPVLAKGKTVITQGFIGGTSENFSTSLGREGSDYTASLLAYFTDASQLSIWKDVPGVLNADPKRFENTLLFPQLSYAEAIEMTYYGASVIHPKTIKPLQNKNIPLKVKSFVNPEAAGTIINNKAFEHPSKPICIVKDNQMLVSVSAQDYSFFIAEKNLSEIFQIISNHHIKVNMMQMAALSFSFCFDMDGFNTPKLLQALTEKFACRYNEGLSLLTLRHYQEKDIKEMMGNKNVFLEQRSRNTFQLIYKP